MEISCLSITIAVCYEEPYRGIPTYKLLYFGITLHCKLLLALNVSFQVFSNYTHFANDLQPI